MLGIPELHVPLRAFAPMVSEDVQDMRINRHLKTPARRRAGRKMPRVGCPRAGAEICSVPTHMRECVADIQFQRRCSRRDFHIVERICHGTAKSGETLLGNSARRKGRRDWRKNSALLREHTCRKCRRQKVVDIRLA